MKILACPCSSESVFLQLQHALGSSEQGAQVRFPPQIAVLTKKSINTHIAFHSESFWVIRVTSRSLENKIVLQFSISNIINKSHTFTSHQGLGRKAVIYRHVYQKMKSFKSSLSNMISAWNYEGTRGKIQAINLTPSMYEDAGGGKTGWLVLVFWRFSWSTVMLAGFPDGMRIYASRAGDQRCWGDFPNTGVFADKTSCFSLLWFQLCSQSRDITDTPALTHASMPAKEKCMRTLHAATFLCQECERRQPSPEWENQREIDERIQLWVTEEAGQTNNTLIICFQQICLWSF